MPKPIVAIVGRPNVGKSALFNRLIRQRLSIVEDTPGVTRDRVYANCELYRRSCTLVDTGGLDPTEKDGLISQVAAQAQVAISEASAILFVVEGKEPVTSLDFRLADLLRVSQKPVLLVANKIDDASPPSGEVYGLQLGDPVGVSAIHGLNIDRIIDWLERSLPLQSEESDEQDGSLKIAIVGRPNVGKSALLNALTRQERSIVSEIPGTTRDAIDTRWEWKGRPITLIDTAGMRKRGKVKLALEYYSVLRSLRAIDRADVVFLLVDHEGPMEQDTKIGGYAHEAGRALVLVVNKWDLIRQSVREETSEAKAQERQERLLRADYERTLRAFLGFMRYAPVAYTSALQRRGIDTLMETAFSVHHQTTQRIPTGPLNRLLKDAVMNNPPSTRKSKPLKLYYATQADVAPPTFVLFVSDPEALHFSYLRYLENQIRKSFGFEGTPLKLVVKAREREERS